MPRSGRPEAANAPTMARRAGVSRGTMLKAVGALVHEGVLRAHSGAGITVNGLNDRTPDVTPTEYPFQTVVRRVIDGIEQGTYTRGNALPPVKNLASECGVSTPTVRRALQDVFMQAGIYPRPVHCYFDGSPQMVTSPTLKECAAPPIRGSCLGIMVAARGLNEDLLHDLIAFAVSQDLPIGIIVDSTPPQSLTSTRPHPLVKVVTPSKGPECGEEVGRMLAALGHRNVLPHAAPGAVAMDPCSAFPVRSLCA